MRALPFLLILLGGPALAQVSQQIASDVVADLDGDGEAEIYTLLDYGEEGVNLSVETDDGFREVPDIAWSGGIPGQRPELSLSPSGSVLLSSGNEAIGRDRWRLVLTIAHREGDWRVAGITYDWWDTIDPAASGHCDVNLLSGRGVVEADGVERRIEAPWPAPRLWDWQGGYFDAWEVCDLG
jgi:hypothetical protein